MQINRDIYLEQLIDGINNGLIKVITGLRRCGKSYLLFNIFRNYLLSRQVPKNHIIEISFDDVMNVEFRDPRKLVLFIKEQIQDDGTYYLLLDEVQMVDNFVGALNSLLRIKNVDVYVTGSNSKFLSSDIATEFRGRGDVIHVYPLSFAEFYSVFKGDFYAAWKEYCTYGGLPFVRSLDAPNKKISYLENLFKSVYIKDIVERNGVKKEAEFWKLTQMMASAVGSPCNSMRLSNSFKSVEKLELNAETISRYLSYLQNAFLIKKVMRYDVKGKRYIGALSKYYFEDVGLRNALLSFRQQDESHIMENIIYNELKIRGFIVDVGFVEHRHNNKENVPYRQQFEVDFVANLGSKRYYIQSALSVPDQEKLLQETRSLYLIPDSFKKIVIVRSDITPWYDENGVLFLGLFDFLLKRDSLDIY